MQPTTMPIEQPPKRHMLLRIILVVIILLGIGTVTFFMIGALQQSRLEDTVKSELIKQNTSLRASAVNNIYKQTLPKTIQSTDSVRIATAISTSGTAYCMTATSSKNDRVSYHMNEKTPVDTPVKGSCADDVTASPSIPGAVSIASTGATSTTLQWSASINAVGYSVQCAKDSNFIDGLILQSAPGTAATLNGLSGDTMYYCRVAAVNKIGQSAWSLAVTARTALYAKAPANMKANIVSSSELSYSWDAVPGARYYSLQYTTDINFTTDVTTVRVDATSGSIKGLKTYTGYFFRAAAITTSFDDTHAAYSDPAFARTKK